MTAPLIDRRTYRDLVAWTEQLAACPRAAPGPGLVGAVLERDVVDPAAPAAEPIATDPEPPAPPVRALAGTVVDADLAAAIAGAGWVRVRDLLVGGELGHSLENPANRRVLPAGPIDAATAEVLEDLARVTGPDVLVGSTLGRALDDPGGGPGWSAGAEVDPFLAGEIDRRAWVRIRTWQPVPASLDPAEPPDAGERGEPSEPVGPDAGGALVRIASRFAELVVERVNRTPERHELAFLNLTGAQPVPPRPARVPLTFTLAASSPVDAVVPAGTQVTAQPMDGEEGEVAFETERSLVVTRAALSAVVVNDTETDTWSDRFAQADGRVDQPFAAFEGDRPTPHQMFIACDQLLTQPGRKDVTLELASTATWQWTNWPISWAWWDGTRWQAVRPSVNTADGKVWRVTLPQLPPVERTLVGHVAGSWLRAQLDMALPPGKEGLAPESVAVGNRAPQDLELPFAPFGDAAPAKFLYLSADEAVGKGRARVRLSVAMDRAGVGPGVQLHWTYRVGSEWLPLGRSSSEATSVGASEVGFEDSTRAFTRPEGVVSFHAPANWPRERFRNRMGRWIRAEVASEGNGYKTLPVVGDLTAGSSWELPEVGAITVQLSRGPEALPPASAWLNTGAVDLSRDFHAFGEEPAFNDTLYLALPENAAHARSQVEVKIVLRNPAGGTFVPAVFATGEAAIAWEMTDGRTWSAIPATPGTPAAGDGATRLTTSGELTLTLPDAVVPSVVNGEEAVWVRARLIGGHYGTPATYEAYTEEKRTLYRPIPATFSGPIVRSISFEPVGAAQPTATASACLTYNGFTYAGQIAGPRPAPPFTTAEDTIPALYLGFDEPFGPRPTTLYLQVEPPRPDEVAAEAFGALDPTTLALLTWEYSSPQGWQPLVAIDDTQSLARPDRVGFMGPADMAPRSCFGQTAHWVRVRWPRGYFPLPPRLRRIMLNTTWARQVTTVRDEVLGSGNGQPHQVFTTAQSPVQPGQQVTVREPEAPTGPGRAALEAEEGPDAVTVTRDAADQPDEVWVRWHAVDDFFTSGPTSRHYAIDPLTGEVRFGDGVQGLVPPAGQNNVRATYRTGGGERGNRAAGTIVQLTSGVPYVDAVTNPEPSQGGAPREPIDRLRARGPLALRHRDRAVTAQDLADLAYGASASVARVAAVAPAFDPFGLWLEAGGSPPGERHRAVDAGRMGVIVVPAGDDARPTPTLSLLDEVRAFLEARGPATADLWVAGPEWVRVTVTATVVPTSFEAADAVSVDVRRSVERFLHPLTGGPAGEGWAFGRKPHRSDLFALVEGLPGVDHVASLGVDHQAETADVNRKRGLERALAMSIAEASREPAAADLRRWLSRALVYSGDHRITVSLAP